MALSVSYCGACARCRPGCSWAGPQGDRLGFVGFDDFVSTPHGGHQAAGPHSFANAVCQIVLTLVERGGSARSFHIDSTSIADIAPILKANIRRKSRLMTDESRHYMETGREYASHEAVNHTAKEYVRGEITTNTVEGYYSIFKRVMKGVYQHCAEKHLHRYLSEFDFRYSNRVALGVNDGERADLAIKGAAGKRLTYRQSN
jgi:hypothetical protein